MLNINKVFKSYLSERGELPVLNGFSLQLERQTVTALIGPSGCGKSTLVKMIAGLEKIDAGSVDFDKQNGSGPQFSIAFQEHGLLEWLTVRENVKLPAKLRRVNIGDNVIEDIISKVGLGGFEEAYPDQLSGGMKSRASVARALVLNSPIVLLDEPFRSLDEATRYSVSKDVFDLLRSRNQTVLLITHSIEEAVRLSDLVVVVSARPMSIMQSIKIELTQQQRLSLDNAQQISIVGKIKDVVFREKISVLT